ncbi:MAG: FoF1 ATP synthase subunit a [Chloroflexota bacterium]
MAKTAKKGCLGCSFPLLIGLIIFFLALFVIGFAAGPIGSRVLSLIGIKLPLPDWISVAKPHPELPAQVVFHIFGFPITNSVVAAWVTIIVVVALFWAITCRSKLIPGRWQAMLEGLLGWLYDFCKSVAGEVNGRRFFPIVATIFIFVAFNAWLGLLPGYGTILVHTPEGETHLLKPANTDINVPLALALISFVFVEYFGLRSRGIRYLGKFFSFGSLLGGLGQLFRGKLKSGLSGIFLGVINAFIGFIELLSEFIRIVSFTFRLFGNMTAGEILLLAVTFLVPWVIAPIFYGLELFVGLVQALIFGGLTLIFLTLAVAHGEEAH